MAKYEQLLRKVAAEMAKYGESLQPPCTEQDLELLRERSRLELGSDIPDEYAQFLRLHNGFVHNGVYIYAADMVPIAGYTDRFMPAFVEENLIAREVEEMKNYLIFGKDSLDIYVLNLERGTYELRTLVCVDLMETFDSFEDMICYALEQSLL